MNAQQASWLWLRAVLISALLPVAASCQGQAAVPPPMSIVELQTTRLRESVPFPDAAGQRGSLTLTNLNPTINAALLLTLQRSDRRETLNYHLENADPAGQRIALDALHPGQLLIDVHGSTTRCALWPGELLEKARRSMLPYAPLCDGKLFLRNAVKGNRSTLEATTEFLRDHVWHGEQIIGFVRREFYRDAFIERAKPAMAEASRSAQASAPPAARMRAATAPHAVVAEGLGIDIGAQGGLLPGQWYAAAGLDGIYVSLAQPGSLAVGATVGTGRSRALDPVEADALAYLVSFDLAAYEVGFALGTEHPRLGWSDRVRDDLRDTRLPGPDGIRSASPLERTGMVSPALQSRVVATFTGGFKREHGAFRQGALAAVNHGSHYGFIEQGVVYSTLVPGLSTLYVLNDGSVGMKTWSKDDKPLLGQIRHARQNGVPLIERDPAGAASVFGALVDAWGPGNWSGSEDEKLRTLRAGACLIEKTGRNFLVYAYFSTATPRAMAQVFQAYGCNYAMHLDMNALEHTYLALYPHKGSHVVVEHLVGGMAVLDKSVGATLVPRFLGFADDRDFFYLTARKERR
jgi:hypothetical protein